MKTLIETRPLPKQVNNVLGLYFLSSKREDTWLKRFLNLQLTVRVLLKFPRIFLFINFIEYTNDLRMATLEFCRDSQAPTPDKSTLPPTLCASYQRPSKSQAIIEHKSRFSLPL